MQVAVSSNGATYTLQVLAEQLCARGEGDLITCVITSVVTDPKESPGGS